MATIYWYYHYYRPLREDEVLPVRTHRVVQHQPTDDVTAEVCY